MNLYDLGTHVGLSIHAHKDEFLYFFKFVYLAYTCTLYSNVLMVQSTVNTTDSLTQQTMSLRKNTNRMAPATHGTVKTNQSA